MVRQRHPVGAHIRDTHTSGNVDFAGGVSKLYGSQMDLEAVTVIDLGQGSVTDSAVIPGGLTGGTGIAPGTLPSSTFDVTPPALPGSIVVISTTVAGVDGVSIVAIKATFTPPADTDYFATYVEATDATDGDPVTPTPVWDRPSVAMVGKGLSAAYVLGVAGATNYYVRLRSVDVQGNYSGYSAIFPLLTLQDNVAPSVPQAFSAAAGFKLIAARWNGSGVPDLMFNEVRYRMTSGAPAGDPVTLRTRGNSIVITDGIVAGQTYEISARSVDYSANVAARWAVTGVASTDVLTCAEHVFVSGDSVQFDDFVGASELNQDLLYVVSPSGNTFQVSLTPGGGPVNFTTDLTSGFVSANPLGAVHYLQQPEAGWTPLVTGLVPTLVGAADVAFNSVITGILSSNEIDADTINTGTLNVSSAGGNASGINVLYNGVVVGEWVESGMRIKSKTPGRENYDYLKIDNASIGIFNDGVFTSGIDINGINASAINFGFGPGGHNLVFNSSFELSAFTASSNVTIGTGGSTFAGGVGGWVLVTNTNGILAAGSITFTPS